MKKWNKYFSLFAIFVLTVFVHSLAYSQAIPDTKPVPEWVQPKLPNLDFDQAYNELKGGIYYLLVDTQIKVDQQQPAHFFYHYANHIANQTGVESNSQINISFDPIYEQVLLHEVKILRNGQEIDKTYSAKKQVIQREDQLEQLIYNGLHTLHIILDDVRVGDTIEYSFSLIGENPVYKGYFSYSHSLEWELPVEDVLVRLIWNKPTALNTEIRNSSLTLSEQNTKWGKEYTIHRHRVERKTVEKGTPIHYEPWAKLYFSELQDWASVSQWGLSLYDGVYETNAELEAFAQEIKTLSTSPSEQVSKALRFVQNEIRYLGIELGLNSHIPSPAYATFDRRYGDCKDKTVLFITLLKQLGIDASPALVNTNLRSQISTLPASPIMFNHVITQVILDGKAIYLDPTRSYQYGDLESIYYPDYGASLVLRPETTQLTMMPAASDNSEVEVHEKFVLGASPEDSVLSTTYTRFTGKHAEQQRRYLDESGQKNFQDDFLNFFQQFYSGSEISQDIELVDNSQKNEFTSTERYKINNLWAKNKEIQGRFDTSFYANIVNSYIDYQDTRTRNTPLYVSHPIKVSQQIEIQFPDQNWAFDKDSFSKETDFFDFSYHANYNADSHLLTLSYDYASKVNEVSAENYPAYFDALDSIENYTSYNIYWNPDFTATDSAGSSFQLTGTHFLLIYLALLLACFVLWRMDKKRHPDPQEGEFYPVSMPKLITMWVLTFGLYGAYWFYRNFKYIKQYEQKPAMPIARGIFSYFWYYPLWKHLRDDSLTKHETNHLPAKGIAILMALLYLVSAFAHNGELFTIPALILSALLVLPMANYILFINQNNAATQHYSRWTWHHYLLILVSLPVCLLTFSSEVGLTPSDTVIEGHRLMDYDTRKFKHKGIIGADENIVYFYSDAFLSNQDDGNGFTEQSVFSFWKDEEGRFNLEKAKYPEIKDIRVNFNNDRLSNSSVTIERHDGSEFILFVANAQKKDLKFVTELKRLWTEKKSPLSHHF